MNTHSRCVLSTVGTSLLTNRADDSTRKRINMLANETEAALSPEDRRLIDEHAEKARAILRDGPVEEIRKASAELNGIIGIYDGRLPEPSGDHHVLIATDTALGRLTAETVGAFLTEQGLSVQIEVIKRLNTRDQGDFEAGMKDLARWCAETLPGYRDAGYRVAFNLAGSFKSLQGYLNTIGMIHADEIVYLFEGTTNLLRIPRLPIQLDLEGLAAWREPFALMAAGLLQPSDRLRDCPEALIEEWETDRYLLSPWGELLWSEAKTTLLAEELLDLPRLRYAPSFIKDFKGHHNRVNRVQLQEALAKVAMLLEGSGGDRATLSRDGGLKYEKLTGKHAGMGHFRTALGVRVECRETDDGLELLHFGEKEGRYR